MQTIVFTICGLLVCGVVAIASAVAGFVFARVTEPAEMVALKKAMQESAAAGKLKQARSAILESLGYDPATESDADE